MMDGIGFHAIGEMILTYAGMPIFPTIDYLSISNKLTNQLSGFSFKKRDNYPIPAMPTGSEVLWNDNTNVQWNDDTDILWNN